MQSLLLVGFFVGIRHAMEADHVAAIASLAMQDFRSANHALRQGVAWGVGHTATLFLFGGIVLAAGTELPQGLAEGLEFAVGIMLIVLGTDLLRRVTTELIHRRTCRHQVCGGALARGALNRDVLLRHERALPLRPLAVGLMHGMAGSAALILLALGSVKSVFTGLLYILSFGLGSVAGMAIFSVLMVLPLRYSAKRMGAAYHGVHGLVGLGTVALGAGMAYRIGSAGVLW